MGSETVGSTPVVFYDANLLYPFHVRNLLVQLGVDSILAPRWTDAIHEEWIGTVVADGRATRDRLRRTKDLMNQVLPDADVRGYEHRIANLVLPDPDDRHVLAAAIETKASILLTFNLKDFPADILGSFGIVARHPDSLLCDLFEADPEAIAAVVDEARLNLSRSAPTTSEFLEILERQKLRGFVRLLRTV